MELWFDEKTAGLIGAIIGVSLGAAGAIIGSTCAVFLRKGWKKHFMGFYTSVIAACLALILTALFAAANDQPYHVWFTFFLPGFLGMVILSSLHKVITNRFTDSELKKMQAEDLE